MRLVGHRGYEKLLFVIPVLLCALAAPGHAVAPAGRYNISNGNVLDTKTGLTWQQYATTTTYTFMDARTHCASLGTGWRMPSMQELMTLLDDTVLNPMIDTSVFPDTVSDAYWTSSIQVATPLYANLVQFSSGVGGGGNITLSQVLVRCVH